MLSQHCIASSRVALAKQSSEYTARPATSTIAKIARTELITKKSTRAGGQRVKVSSIPNRRFPRAFAAKSFSYFARNSSHPHISLLTFFNSITSICLGHSGQLCIQHTITAHFLGSCPCSRKLRLSNSNSIHTRFHLPATEPHAPLPPAQIQR